MRNVQKAIEISDAKIQFVSLVDKAANQKRFLITKQEGGQAQFSTYSKILKIDAETHYITGIVYEPMTEDAHGNFMTEEEIRKAAYWFAKNGDKVDLQHSFETVDGLTVVENYVAPCDLTIGDTPVAKGSWVLTVECSNDTVWQSVQKGELTGFSMGGFGKYSEEDVNLEEVTKAGENAKTGGDTAEKKSLFKRLAKFLDLDLVEKGEVMDRYQANVKYDQFWNAMWALEDVLYRYNWANDRYVFASDETTIKEALADFNSIITEILTQPDSAIMKAVSLPVVKAGKKMSSANKAKLDEICQALTDFKASFDEDEGGEDGSEGEVTKKEDKDMTRAETEAIVSEEITKALTQAGVIKAEPAPAPAQNPAPAAGDPVEKQAAAPAAAATPNLEELVAKAADNAVRKALIEAGVIEEEPDPDAPVTKAEIEQVVADAIAPLMKAFRMPQNLNNLETVQKQGEVHYLHGIL